MKIKLETPPPLRGSESQQLSSIHSYLYRLTERLNLNLDSLPDAPSSGQPYSDRSPRAMFNSMKRLICQSTELFDSIYGKALPLLQELFPSMDSFTLLSAKTDTDRQELEEAISACQEEIAKSEEGLRAALPNFVELENFTIRRWDGGCTELWGSLDTEQTEHALPIAFDTALCIPQGTVTGSVLTVEEGLGQIYITGKEIR